jgi:nucleoside-diphosphate-sugar epimerase
MTTTSPTPDDVARDAQVDTGLDAVTGAFSYSGHAIAAALAARGRRVRTLTGHPARAPVDTDIEIRPLDFDDHGGLARSLVGTTTLYNTYWVRFPHGPIDHAMAVANSQTLFRAARAAGVQRVVHVSITNPSVDSPDPYFRGKALVEQALTAGDISYAIVRPAVLFGGDGVLLNNIAWLLRRFPIFAVGGTGEYRLRPIHIDDLAQLCVTLGAARDNTVVDAVGPDRPTFRELSEAIRAAVGSRAPIIRVPGFVIPALSRLLGLFVHDVLLTRDEYRSMAAGRADVDGPATGATSVLDWVAANGSELGRRYANELARHFDR